DQRPFEACGWCCNAAAGEMLSPMLRTEIRSFSEIAAASLAQPSATARDVHSAVAARVFGLLGPLGAPAPLLHDGISAASYRMAGAALRGPVRAGGAFLARTAPEGRPIRDTAIGAHALGAFNGIVGDRLARDHPEVALDLAFRRRGRDSPLDAE